MKILVTTDFSTNSKAAIRFVQSLANQSDKIEATFYFGANMLPPPRTTNDDFFANYKKGEIKRLTNELKIFVLAVIKKDKQNFAALKYAVDPVSSVEKDILSFSEKNKFEYICMATEGAGVLRKIMGTHTSYIVNNSKIPVLAIPSHYRSKPLKKATYLSDFENLNEELPIISSFSNDINCVLKALHYTPAVADKKKIDKKIEFFDQKEFKNIKLRLNSDNYELTLIEKVAQYVEKHSPELLIMFTKKKKGFFESIFLPSKSAELTYSTKVPVLIFSK